MDKEIMDLAGLGSTTRLSTMDLIGLWVFLAISDASTFHLSREIKVDISDPDAHSKIHRVSRQQIHRSLNGHSLLITNRMFFGRRNYFVGEKLKNRQAIILVQVVFHYWDEICSDLPIIKILDRGLGDEWTGSIGRLDPTPSVVINLNRFPVCVHQRFSTISSVVSSRSGNPLIRSLYAKSRVRTSCEF